MIREMNDEENGNEATQLLQNKEDGLRPSLISGGGKRMI